MPNAPAAPKISMLRFLIEAAGPQGFFLLFLSFVLIVWGLVNLAAVKNRSALAGYAILSLAPAFMGCLFLIGLFNPVVKFMTEPAPHEPSEVAALLSTILVNGILASGCSIPPAVLGIAALTRRFGTLPAAAIRSPVRGEDH